MYLSTVRLSNPLKSDDTSGEFQESEEFHLCWLYRLSTPVTEYMSRNARVRMPPPRSRFEKSVFPAPLGPTATQFSPSRRVNEKGSLNLHSGNLANELSTIVSMPQPDRSFYELCAEFLYLGIGIVAPCPEIELDFRFRT